MESYKEKMQEFFDNLPPILQSGVLEGLAYSAIQDYLEDETIPKELRDKMVKDVDECKLYEYDDWEKMCDNVTINQIVYKALQRWEDNKFKNSGLSIAKIGDVRSMMSDLKYR